MTLPVSLQAVQLGLSAALGLALGLHYDLLWLLRKWWPRLTHLLDAWFWLTSLLAGLLLALYVGLGEFRLFFFVGIGSGMALWFLCLSRLFRRMLRLLFHILGLPWRLLGRVSKKIGRKIKKIVKAPFSRAHKWYMIRKQKNGFRKGDSRHASQHISPPASHVDHHRAFSRAKHRAHRAARADEASTAGQRSA